MRVDLLCSGSKGNSCLVRSHGSSILIDCGSTKKHLFQSLKDAKADLSNMDGVLITHGHVDHISQLKHVAHLPIYSYCDLKDVQNHTIVQPKESFDLGHFHIQVIGLSHDAPNTVGYVIEDGAEKLVYITDTGYVPNVYKPLLENADTYIFESNHDVKTLMSTSRPMFVKQRILGDSGHLNNEDASLNLSQLVNMKTKDIILAHISQEGNTPDLALETLHSCFLKRDLPLHSIRIQAAGQYERMVVDKSVSI